MESIFVNIDSGCLDVGAGEAEETLGSDRYVHSLVWGDGFTCVVTCQNVSACSLYIHAVSHMSIHLKKLFLKNPNSGLSHSKRNTWDGKGISLVA